MRYDSNAPPVSQPGNIRSRELEQEANWNGLPGRQKPAACNWGHKLPETQKMKLIIAIVNEEDSPNLLDRLGRRGYAATITGTRGGFLRISNATIFCGVQDEQVEDVLTVFRESCTSRVQYVTPLPPVMEPGEMHIPTPVEKQVGGATIFVVPVDHFEKI